MHVLFQFIEGEGGTDVVITHEGIPSDAGCTVHENGWGGALNSLKRFLEKTASADVEK